MEKVIGKVAVTPRGAYVSGTYQKLDLVTYANAGYVSRIDNNTALPTDAAKWMKLVEDGKPGNDGAPGTPGDGGTVKKLNEVGPDSAGNISVNTDNIPQTASKQYVSTTEKSNWNGASIGSNLGLLKTTDTPPPTGTHKGDVNSAGTYTNFKTAAAVSIVFTAPELVDNYGFIYVKDNVATKSLVAKKGGDEITKGTASQLYSKANSNPTVIFNAILDNTTTFKPIWHVGNKVFSDATGAVIDLGVIIGDLSITPIVEWNGEASKVINITTSNPTDTWSLSSLPSGVTASALSGTGNSNVTLNFANTFYAVDDAVMTLTSMGNTKTSTLKDVLKELVIKIKLTADNQTFVVPTKSGRVGYNYNVRYGDGSGSVNYTTATASKAYTGLSGTEFTVRISGNVIDFDFTGINGTSKLLMRSIEKNTLDKDIQTMSLSGCTNLIKLGKNAFSSFNGNSLDNAVKDCGVNGAGFSIDKDAFKGLTQITSIKNLFSLSKVISIPAGLFNDFTSVIDASFIFYTNKALTTLPIGLLDTMTLLTNVSYFIGSTPTLVSVPNRLFRYQTGLLNVEQAFRLDANLVADASILYTDMNQGSPTITVGCFMNAPLMTNLASVPTSWKS